MAYEGRIRLDAIFTVTCECGTESVFRFIKDDLIPDKHVYIGAPMARENFLCVNRECKNNYFLRVDARKIRSGEC
jgi:hypothetical protein